MRYGNAVDIKMLFVPVGGITLSGIAIVTVSNCAFSASKTRFFVS